MENLKEVEEMARKIRNQKVREWRAKNKDKVKEANKRYWEKKAREYLKQEKGEN